jgi:hypothetical protein
MVRQRMKLPKDQAVEPEDVRPSATGTGDDDVEGHGFPVTAPPSPVIGRGTGHGGEATPTEDDATDVKGNLGQ